ncbi:MAG: hypothetical protein RR531_07955 [Longicatena sp.]
MKLSAVFVVDESCINEMLSMQEAKRMDYLLGIDENQNFENHIIDMDDFMEMPSNFYSKIKNQILNCSELEEHKLNYLYCKPKYRICFLTMEQLSCIHKKLYHKKELKKKLHNCFESDDARIPENGISLSQQAERFINLLFTKRTLNQYTLLVFDNDEMSNRM